MACKRGASTIVDILLQNGADITLADITGNRPIHIACSLGHSECVNSLMRYGADPTIPNLAGDPAFHLACRCLHADTVRLLLYKRPQSTRCFNLVTFLN